MCDLQILESIRSRGDLLALTPDGQAQLCREIREFLLTRVADHGGHLASNLGIVETTLAIHQVFDTSVDRLVFDVGHQSYVHKILTGRMDGFSGLRQLGGLSGFPKPEESVHDAFIAGHASDSVSVALGMARARTRTGKNYSVVALIGDGALTGGLAYEGLNDAGESGEDLIVVLNDNGMSISRNVGAISRHLALLRLKPGYFGLKKAYRRFTGWLPGGKYLYRFTHKVKSVLKRGLIGTTVFEEMGMTYLGPVDGHDTEKVAYLLRTAKEMGGPVLVHVSTQKGRGYIPAECAPQNYHGVGQFDPLVGVCESGSGSLSAVFGSELYKLAEEDSRVCAITAAMPQGTGLTEFASRFPDRFFDVGIAEGHAVCMAAGMAAQGMIPVCAVYSTFLQRAFDMLLHDTALLHLHTVFAVDRAGLVGADGPTHHGVFDVGYLRQVPGMTVLSPATAEQLRAALRQAVFELSGPVAVRYPRGGGMKKQPLPEPTGKEEAAVIAYGEMLPSALEAVRLLDGRAALYPLLCLKPLEEEKILALLRRVHVAVVAEDTVANGSVGQEIAALAAREGLSCRVLLMNLGDRFTAQGSVGQLLSAEGLDGVSIAERVKEALENAA